MGGENYLPKSCNLSVIILVAELVDSLKRYFHNVSVPVYSTSEYSFVVEFCDGVLLVCVVCEHFFFDVFFREVERVRFFR